MEISEKRQQELKRKSEMFNDLITKKPCIRIDSSDDEAPRPQPAHAAARRANPSPINIIPIDADDENSNGAPAIVDARRSALAPPPNNAASGSPSPAPAQASVSSLPAVGERLTSVLALKLKGGRSGRKSLMPVKRAVTPTVVDDDDDEEEAKTAPGSDTDDSMVAARLSSLQRENVERDDGADDSKTAASTDSADDEEEKTDTCDEASSAASETLAPAALETSLADVSKDATNDDEEEEMEVEHVDSPSAAMFGSDDATGDDEKESENGVDDAKKGDAEKGKDVALPNGDTAEVDAAKPSETDQTPVQDGAGDAGKSPVNVAQEEGGSDAMTTRVNERSKAKLRMLRRSSGSSSERAPNKR